MAYEPQVTSYLKMGIKRANASADADNALRLGECGAADSCQDYHASTVPNTRTVVSAVFDGVTYTAATPIAITDAAAIQAWLESVVANKEFDYYVRVTSTVNTTNQDVTIEHVGQLSLSLITLNTGTMTLTRCCTVINHTIYNLGVVDDPGQITFEGGSAQTLANVPYAYSGTLVTDEATAAQLRTDFIAALTAIGLEDSYVEVDVDIQNENYKISYLSPGDAPVAAGANDFVNSGYQEIFDCS